MILPGSRWSEASLSAQGSDLESRRIVELLEELVIWTRLAGINNARESLSEALKKDSEKLGYHYSDGRGSAEVGKMAGVSDFAVRSYWKKWAALGLMAPSKKFRGRFERLFSLYDLGFDVPPPKAAPPAAGADREQPPNVNEGDTP
jgi:hypothetical protein